jgi:hypothetical protein
MDFHSSFLPDSRDTLRLSPCYCGLSPSCDHCNRYLVLRLSLYYQDFGNGRDGHDSLPLIQSLLEAKFNRVPIVQDFEGTTIGANRFIRLNAWLVQ